MGDGPWAMAQFRAISTAAAPQEWAPMRLLVRIVQTPGRVRGAHSLTGAACAPAMRVYRRGGAETRDITMVKPLEKSIEFWDGHGLLRLVEL